MSWSGHDMAGKATESNPSHARTESSRSTRRQMSTSVATRFVLNLNVFYDEKAGNLKMKQFFMRVFCENEASSENPWWEI